MTKLNNFNCEKLKKSDSDKTKKTQIGTILNSFRCDKNQNLKFLQDLKIRNCDKTQINL